MLLWACMCIYTDSTYLQTRELQMIHRAKELKCKFIVVQKNRNPCIISFMIHIFHHVFWTPCKHGFQHFLAPK